MTEKFLKTFDKERLFDILDMECNLSVPCRNALNLSITELDIDSMELSNISYILGREFNLRINFENITSRTTLDELFLDVVSLED
jgi:hypothetical protein